MELRTERAVCQICGEPKPRRTLVHASLVRPMLAEQAQRTTGHWDPEGYVCHEDLDHLRVDYVRSALEAGKEEVDALDAAVLQSLDAPTPLSRNVVAEYHARSTLGERVADRVASFGGSWRFIGIAAAALAAWMLLNWRLLSSPFDPYPFILLNLVLSTLAALQAPIIMMSQNRQEQRDRLQAENDYQVNLKAELEIRMLMLKVDGLLHHQWQRLLDIQEVQTELLEEMRAAAGSAR